MRIVDIIEKKKNGGELTPDEISFFIEGYTSGKIPDYQAAALCMAICLVGMTQEETAALTHSMAYSGETADLSGIQGTVTDKHSTGGVGDTTTLITAPIAAACGVKVAKMSGRGLGHTGGTIDKLESIPGFKTELGIETFRELVNKNSIAITGQSEKFALADKKLYALRDVTGTIDSIPLIASSIMSKKIAAGAKSIVLDVKTGSGAFMKDTEQAFDLAKAMCEIGKRSGIATAAVVTHRDETGGSFIANALEVKEAILCLSGEDTSEGLMEVSELLACHMLLASKTEVDFEEAKAKVEKALNSGAALEKLRVLIKSQGGDERVIDDVSLLGKAESVIEIYSETQGYIQKVDARMIGTAVQLLGAGRADKNDIIDKSVGAIIHKRTGDRIQKGERLGELHVNDKTNLNKAMDLFKRAFVIGEVAEKPKLVLGTVTDGKEERYD